MAEPDKCVTIVPYFRVKDGSLEAFKKISRQCVDQTQAEPGCLFYGFAFNGNLAHVREGYADAAALLTHVQNIGPLIEQLLKLSEMTRLEVHGPDKELAGLRGALARFNPEYFVLESGFRR